MSESTADVEWADQVARVSKPRQPEEYVTLHDDEAVSAVAAAAADLAVARRRARSRLVEETADYDLQSAVEADEEVTAARRLFEEAEVEKARLDVVFHLRGLEPNEYDDLVLAHPPTDEQEGQGMIWNPKTFFPALLAACSVKPLTVEQAEAILSAGNTGDAGALISVCRRLNEQGRLSLGKGSRPTPT